MNNNNVFTQLHHTIICIILNYKSFLSFFCIHIKLRGLCMIIEEFKSESTLIRFDDRDIETKESNEEIINILVGLIIKRMSEYY